MAQIPGFSEGQSWLIVFTAGGAFVASTVKNIMTLVRSFQDKRGGSGNGFSKDIVAAITKDGELTRGAIEKQGDRSREDIRTLMTNVRAEIELAVLKVARRPTGAS